MKTWKVLRSFVLFLLLTMTLGCQADRQVDPEQTDYDFAITAGNKAVLLKEEGGQLVSKGEVTLFERNFLSRDREVGIYQREFLRLGQDLYGATHRSETDKEYLFRLDPRKLTMELKEPGSGRIYSTFSDSQHLYTTFQTDVIHLYQYDQDLEFLKEQVFSHEEGVLDTPTSSQQVGDRIYLLNTQTKLDGSMQDPDTHRQELWVLNQELDIEQKIHLEYSNVGYEGMRLVGRKLYLSEWIADGYQSDGEPNPGTHLLVYDLDTGKQEQIALTKPYPQYLYYDADKDRLLVLHDIDQLREFVCTLIDLKTGKQEVMDFHDLAPDSWDIHFYQKGSDYYFLLDRHLVKMDPDTLERTVFPLKAYHLDRDRADSLIFKE